MGRVLTAVTLVLSLAGCDAPAVVGGSAELKQAEQAQATEERVRGQVDAAARSDDAQRREAERQGR